MTLKEVMKNIRNMRQLTAVGMAMILGITPSYLSQIENKGCIPLWFIDKLTSTFNLNHNEINSLNEALNKIYDTAGDKVGVKTRIIKLKQDCIAKLYALISSILTGSADVSKQIHLEIIAILEEMRKFYENKNETLI